MKRVIVVIVAGIMLLGAGSAWAWKKPPFENVDRDKNGVIVYDEMVKFNSGLTVEVFGIIDLNKDGKVDGKEYAAMGGASAKAGKGRWWKCSGKDGIELYAKGTNALVAGKNAEAICLLNDAVTKNLCVDYLSFAYYNLGIAYMRTGDEAKAKKALERARALNINNVVPENDFGLDGTPRHGGKK